MTASPDADVLAERDDIDKFTRIGLEALGPCPPHLKETTIQVPLPDGTTQRTVVFWPANTTKDTKNLPLIVFFHGGGWTTGGPEFAFSPARGYAGLLGAIVACPSYKYAPENPFPAPMHSAWDVTAWLSRPDNLSGPAAAALGDDRVRFDPGLGMVLGGVSAGANLAAVIAGVSAAAAAAAAAGGTSGLARGRGELSQPVRGVFLSVPMLLHESSVPAEYAPAWTSRAENPDGPVINTASLALTGARLRADYRSPWFSPLNLDLGGLAGRHAPRVYLQAGQLDGLRDDAVVYERALRERGVAETRIDVIKGVGHIGWCTLPVPEVHSDEVRTKSLDGMAWLLGTEWDRSRELPY